MLSEIINPSRAGMPSYARASVDETRGAAARAALAGAIPRPFAGRRTIEHACINQWQGRCWLHSGPAFGLYWRPARGRATAKGLLA